MTRHVVAQVHFDSNEDGDVTCCCGTICRVKAYPEHRARKANHTLAVEDFWPRAVVEGRKRGAFPGRVE
jgi:hypothetical protein